MYESKPLFTYAHIYMYVCSFKASIKFLRLVLIVALFLSFCKNVPDRWNVVFDRIFIDGYKWT